VCHCDVGSALSDVEGGIVEVVAVSEAMARGVPQWIGSGRDQTAASYRPGE
jgi:hypothetical protein